MDGYEERVGAMNMGEDKGSIEPWASPGFIGLAGPSGSGKSSVARRLAERLKAEGSAVLPLDAYYHSLENVPEFERRARNFDVPDALDSRLLFAHIEALSAGRPVQRPQYDFATHTRRPSTAPLAPARWIIVEGLHTLWWVEVRRRLHLAVYLDVSETEALARRRRRDQLIRGRAHLDVESQFWDTVVPMAKRYVYPTRDYADFVIAGETPLDTIVQAIYEQIVRDETGAEGKDR